MTDWMKPLARPHVVLKEEFDDWGTLIDHESGTSFAINPISVFIWKRMDGINTMADIIKEVEASFGNVPADAGDRLTTFVRTLEEKGFVELVLEHA